MSQPPSLLDVLRELDDLFSKLFKDAVTRGYAMTAKQDLLSRIRQDLAQAKAFPVATRRVSTSETHISLVFLTDTRAYKLKKPVKFPFLDYSTLELRRAACDDEVRLNRRLAPDVYLGVRAIVDDGTCLRVGGAGPVVEYCVEMVRLPDDALLDRRIAAGTASDEDIERLLDVLVPFYAALPRTPQLNKLASPEALDHLVRENVDTLAPLVSTDNSVALARVRSSQWQYLAVMEKQFRERMEAGAIVEGHGDLRPEHVCLLDPPVVYDAVEFSLDFRAGDVASELAFLAMECDFLSAATLGRTLIDGYRQRTGDSLPTHLVAFYQAYRATVRAKVERLRSTQQTGEDADERRRRHHRYLHLAGAYASDFHHPVLVVFMGAAGVGKSTVARALADRIGLEVFRSDAFRQGLAGRRDPDAPIGQGMYGTEMTKRTYDALLEAARDYLLAGVSVALDATSLDPAFRDRARQTARAAGCASLFVWCQCPPAVAEARIAQRRAENSDISDARPELHREQVAILQGASDLADATTVVLDTTRATSLNVEVIVDALRRFGYA